MDCAYKTLFKQHNDCEESSYDSYDRSPIVYDKVNIGETVIYYSYWKDWIISYLNWYNWITIILNRISYGKECWFKK